MSASCKHVNELILRHPANPILTVDNMPEGGTMVMNSGFVEKDGKVHAMIYSPSRSYEHRFFHATSDDGVRFDVEPRNLIHIPEDWFHQGVYDIRITKMQEAFYATCNVGHNSYGTRIYLRRTQDFVNWENLGFITAPSQRNCVIFPEKVNGLYCRLERPHGGGTEGDIYISYSPDLAFWGKTKLLYAKGREYWESFKVGPGAPPVKTPEGWLVIYHGVWGGCNGLVYNAGCMLLDLENPEIIRGCMKNFLFAPFESYERVGFVANVVFPTAAIVHGKPDELKIYYGSADSCVCLATAKVSELVAACLAEPYKRHWSYA